MTTSVVLAASVVLVIVASAAIRRERAVVGRLCRAWRTVGGRPINVTVEGLHRRFGGLYPLVQGHGRRVWNGLQCSTGGSDLLAFCLASQHGFGHQHRRRRVFVVHMRLRRDCGRLLVLPGSGRPGWGYDEYVERPGSPGVWQPAHEPDRPGVAESLLSAVTDAAPESGVELRDSSLVLWQPYHHSAVQCERLVQAARVLCESLSADRTEPAGVSHGA